MNKAQMRRNLLQEQRVNSEKDSLIQKNLLSLKDFIEADLLLIYVSMGTEIDTLKLIDRCFGAGKRVAVPRVNTAGMAFFEISSLRETELGKFGISEPLKTCKNAQISSNTFCVTPALACDLQGFRLGRGGGYYDRFLADYKGKSAVLCYSENVIALPVEAHDIAVDFIITEGGVVVVRG